MRTVLIADSDPFQHQLIDMLLAVDNHRIIGFETGRGVLEYLQSHVPDLVILDYNLPDINGADLCAKMKKVKRLARVPVILVTAAHKLELVRGIAAAVRANLVLAKPLGDKQLREQVLNLFNTEPPTTEVIPASASMVHIDPILEQALDNLKQELPSLSYAEVSQRDVAISNAITPVPIDRDEPAPYSLELPPLSQHALSQQSEFRQPPFAPEPSEPLFRESSDEVQSREFRSGEASPHESYQHEVQSPIFQQDAASALESLLGKNADEEVAQTESGVFELPDEGISEQELLESLTTPLETGRPSEASQLAEALFASPDLNPPPFSEAQVSESLEPQPYTLGDTLPAPISDLHTTFEETVSDIEAEMATMRVQVQQLSAENERLRATLLELESGTSLTTSKSYLDMVEELELLRRLSEIQVKQLDSLQRQNQKLLEEAQQTQERKRGLFGFLQPKN